MLACESSGSWQRCIHHDTHTSVHTWLRSRFSAPNIQIAVQEFVLVTVAMLRLCASA